MISDRIPMSPEPTRRTTVGHIGKDAVGLRMVRAAWRNCRRRAACEASFPTCFRSFASRAASASACSISRLSCVRGRLLEVSTDIEIADSSAVCKVATKGGQPLLRFPFEKKAHERVQDEPKPARPANEIVAVLDR